MWLCVARGFAIKHLLAQPIQRPRNKIAFQSSYHPQTDDQTNVLNKVLEAYFRSVTTPIHGINSSISQGYGTTHHTTPPSEPLPSSLVRTTTAHHHRHVPHTANGHNEYKTLTIADSRRSPLETEPPSQPPPHLSPSGQPPH